MAAVHDWLNSDRDFTAGVALYAQLGGSALYQRMFATTGASDTNKARLLTELQKLAGAAQVPVPDPPAPAKPNPVAAARPAPTKEAESRRYLELLKKRDLLYRKLDHLHVQKRFLPDGDALRDCAFSILSTHQQISECWTQIDYYQEYDTFPDLKAKPVRSKDTEIQYLRVSISKAQSRLKQPGCRNREQTERLLKQKQDELSKLI
jgi:hypothetical protein